MNTSRWIAALFICAAGAMATGWYFGRLPAASPPAGLGSWPESRADEFLSEAFRAQTAGTPDDRERAKLLSGTALRRQADSPASATAVWKTLQAELAHAAGTGSSDSSRDMECLSRLLSYQDELDNALLACRSLVEFNDAWQVHEQVRTEIDAACNRASQHLAQQVQQFMDAHASTEHDPIQAIHAFALFQSQHEPQLLALVGASPEDDLSAALDAVQGLVKVLLDHAGNMTQSASQAAQAMQSRLRDGKDPVDPLPSTSPRSATDQPRGPCEGELSRLGELEEVLQEARLEHWRSLLSRLQPDASAAAPAIHTGTGDRDMHKPDAVDGLGQRIADARLDWLRMQQLAYNLWALRELEAAETSDAWVDRLGRVDPGLLEPSVSALYASVHSRRLEEVQDPVQRSNAVRNILTNAKVSLQEF